MRLILSLLLLPGCFSPDPNKFTIRCEPNEPRCPTGRVCGKESGLCLFPDQISDPPDASMMADAGLMSDMASPLDLTAAAPGCKSGKGRVISSVMHACPGVFAWPDDIYKQCAAGWSLCKTNVAGADCNGRLPNTEFYLADVPVGQVSGPTWNTSARAGWSGIPASSGLRGVAGCGNGTGSLTGPPNLTVPAGFGLVATTYNPANPPNPAFFSGPYQSGNDLDMQLVKTGSDVRTGVLCCH